MINKTSHYCLSDSCVWVLLPSLITSYRKKCCHDSCCGVGATGCGFGGGGLEMCSGRLDVFFDRVCNTVWIITRESLSLDREPSYLSSPVSIKLYPGIKQCLWIKGWFWLNYTLYKECLLRENECQRGGRKSPWLGSGSSVQNEPWRNVSGNCSQNICIGTKDTWLIALGFGWDHSPGFVL